MKLHVRTHKSAPLSWSVALVFGVLLLASSTPGIISHYFVYTASQLTDWEALSEQPQDKRLARFEKASGLFRQAVGYGIGDRKVYRAQIDLYTRYEALLRQVSQVEKADQYRVEIERLLSSSLRRAPGDSNFWFLRAKMRALKSKFDSRSNSYLNMSYLTGPREGWVAIRRLAFSLRYWLLLRPEAQHQVRREIRTLWRETSLRRWLIDVFVKSNNRASGIIYSEVSGIDEQEAVKLIKTARKRGWRGKVGTVFH
jgi:hypothetical protein